MSISKRIESISPSITLAISAKAKQMKADGLDVIGLGAGEPDFDTPVHIKEAAKAAIDSGFTKYTPASGTKELKEAICAKFKKDNGLDYKINEILVSCGAKHSLYNAIVALAQEGDEVIILAPFWVSYPEMVKAAGAKAVVINTTQEDSFKITPGQLEEAITDKTKILILNSPSNPTGSAYTKDELKEIADIVVKNKIFCITDEIYEKIVYDGATHTSIASFGQEIKDLSIVINGVSKVYSMTGWRIGYAAAEASIIKAMSNLQSHSTSNPTSIAQKAALAALEGDQACVEEMVSAFAKRREYMVKTLNDMDGISCRNPEGAFYVFPSIENILNKKYKGEVLGDSLNFCKILLDEANVAAVPGIAFGKEGCVRLSYATSMENIEKSLERIKDFINSLV